MTHEEVKLWLQIKHINKRGYHFRRQAPSDGYILDFMEFTCRIVIEVDGAQHGEFSQQKSDARRDAHFMAQGFKILRFWNFQINQEMDGVVDHILSVLPLSPPARVAPPPPKGGG